jgi:glycosyltransferase involved in cell wall biosynthesis
MRILHAGKYYPPFMGGMETVLRDLAEGCLDRGCDVHVVTAGEGPEERSEDIRGPRTGRTGRLVRMGVHGVVNSQPLTLSVAGVLRREIAEFQPDLVHLHLPNPLAAAGWLALEAMPGLSLPPLAVWYHADITRQRVGRLLVEPVVRACLAKAVGISVSSKSLATSSSVLAPLADRVRVIPFGIEPQPWTDVQPGPGANILFVGRLVSYKGLGVLLESLARLPEGSLVIVGDGPERQSLERQAKQLGVSGRVRFAGTLSRADLADEMSAALLLVLPSLDRSETFGLVQLEAMAAGLPVVSTDLATGVSEVGHDGETGLVVPPGDAPALADALGTLLKDPGRATAMGAAGRQRFLDQFTREVMVDHLLAWYDDLLRQGVSG